MLGFHLFPDHLISLNGLSEVGAEIQLDIVQINVFDLLMDLPVSSAISDG
jgi:hypothetical protein